jgi:hypothetical protein
VQEYSRESTWSWDTTGYDIGQYHIQVDVRGLGSSEDREAAKVMSYELVGPTTATGVALTADVVSPYVPGEVVTFSALAEPEGDVYEYRFWLRANGIWSVVQEYSRESTWSWDTTGFEVGDYWIQVDVRSIVSFVNREAADVKMLSLY